MRFLFTLSIPASGHFHPLVPIARALQQAGHEVGFATAPSFQHTVEENGFQHLPASVDIQQVMGSSTPEQMQKRMGEMMRQGPEARRAHMANMFVGSFAHRMVPDLSSVVDRWRPDALVRDTTEFGACVVGEKKGIPYASIQVGGGRLADLSGEPLTSRLNELRAASGLPPDPTQAMLFPFLHLSFMPPLYFGGARELPPTTHFLQPATFDRSGKEELPDWAGKLGGRPLVYFSLGTVFNKLTHVFATIIEGLCDERLDLVVTVGRDLDPARFGPQPPNVHIERYIPNSLLLPKCDLAVMHGGYNSVMSALAEGVPMVIVPLAADQPMNARACQELGAAQVVDVEHLTPELIRERVRDGLKNPSYREAARSFQTEARTLPPLAHGVELLERLAREKRPLPARP